MFRRYGIFVAALVINIRKANPSHSNDDPDLLFGHASNRMVTVPDLLLQ